jgi:hypothetical protein
VNFDNPADQPIEADFTVIVTGTCVYVLVDGEVVGEYSLPQNRILEGNLGLTLLSGTNKDYGTRCEMTNIHAGCRITDIRVPSREINMKTEPLSLLSLLSSWHRATRRAAIAAGSCHIRPAHCHANSHPDGDSYRLLPRPAHFNLAAPRGGTGAGAKYLELGYLSSTEGKFEEYDDFDEEWAQLGWYNWWVLPDRAGNFYMKAHFKWSSAYRNADISGCGFVFAIQDNNDHYAVFLDRTKILFLDSDSSYSYSRSVGLTSGTGRVQFTNNPADQPIEADFTIIVNEATPACWWMMKWSANTRCHKARSYRQPGPDAALGTNKDYGAREMTISAFILDD